MSTSLIRVPTSPTPSRDPKAELVRALHDFDQALTDEQKRILHVNSAPLDADGVLTFVKALDAQQHVKARKGFSPRLCTFLQATEQFTGIVDTFVSSHPTVAALVWGSIRATILSITNLATYFDKVTEMIMSIGGRSPTLQSFGLLYPSSVGLQSALCDYYAIVVRLCSKILLVSQRSAWRQLLWPVGNSFDIEFQPIHNDTDKALDEIRIQISLASKQAERQEAQLSKIDRQENRKQRLSLSLFQQQSRKEFIEAREWRLEAAKRERFRLQSAIMDNLSQVDFFKSWKQAMQRCFPGTAEWFKQASSFENWLAELDSSTLWCYGKMGTGKTVLASNIIAHLTALREHDDQVAFFFCRADHSQTLLARQVIGSLTAQLLKSSMASWDDTTLSQIHQERRDCDTSDITQLLCTRLEIPAIQYVVLDGVDECDEAQIRIIAKAIDMIVDQASVTFKIICLGHPELEHRLFTTKKPMYRMNLGQTQVQNDIQDYIDGTLKKCLQDHELKLGDSGIFPEITNTLKCGADGMFLWTRLLIDEICTQNSDEDILRTIHNLPKDMSELLTRKIQRIVSGRKSSSVLKLLKLCGVAKRPLTVAELREALNIELDQKSLDFYRLSNDMTSLFFDCYGLIVVDEEDESVQYVHHSISQFLFRVSNPYAAQFGHAELKQHLGFICLTYLNFSNFTGQLSRSSPNANARLSPLSMGVNAITRSSRFQRDVAQVLLKTGNRKDVSVSALGHKLEEFHVKSETARLEAELKRRQISFEFLFYARHHWIDHLHDITPSKNATMWAIFAKCVDGMISVADLPWKSNNLSYRTESGTGVDLVSADIQWLSSHRHLAYFLWRLNLKPFRMSSSDQRHILLTSCSKGDLEFVVAMLKTGSIQNDLEEGLYLAAQNGHVECVLKVLSAGASAKSVKDGTSALQAALRGGYADVARVLIHYDADVNAIDSKGDTALHTAAIRGYEDVVSLLVSRGAQLDTRDRFERTALHRAAYFGHLEVVHELIAISSNLNIVDKEGETPLLIAGARGHVHICKALLDCEVKLHDAIIESRRSAVAVAEMGGIDMEDRKQVTCVGLSIRAAHGRTVLFQAALSGHAEVVDVLCKYGADAGTCDVDGFSPLTAVAASGHTRVIKSLLAHGVDVNCADQNGYSALCFAASSGHTEMVKVLLANQADPSMRFVGDTALHVACENGHLDTVEVLVQSSADVNSNDEYDGYTPLMLAVREGYTPVVKMLFDHHVDLEIAANDGRTALHYATSMKPDKVDDYRILKLLLSHHANVNASADFGWTPLIEATYTSNFMAVDMLLSHGANPKSQRSNGETALHLAVRAGRPSETRLKMSRILLLHGADVNSSDKLGQTPLMLAIKNTDLGLVNLLLDHHADVNACTLPGDDGSEEGDGDDNERGSTALHVAINTKVFSEDKVEIVRILLRHNVEVDARDKRDRTPLMLAVNKCDPDLVKLLLNHDADINACDCNGNTPLHIAGKGSKDTTEIVQILVSLDANLNARNHHRSTPLTVAKLLGHRETERLLTAAGAEI